MLVMRILEKNSWYYDERIEMKNKIYFSYLNWVVLPWLPNQISAFRIRGDWSIPGHRV